MEINPVTIFVSLGIVLLLEGSLTLIFLWITRSPIRLVLWLLAANIVTVLMALLIVPGFFRGFMGIPAFFLASWVLEAVALSVLWRKHLKIPVTIAFTFAVNFFSTLVGIMLFMLITTKP
ncbi:MAG: hypothetical protein R6V49_07465 [Bacteroidales bacterium]